jgi:hypothetical protein
MGRLGDTWDWTPDLQFSLFDVDDLGNPQLADQLAIPIQLTRNWDIFRDHHVVAYYPESHILTIGVPEEKLWDANGSCYGWADDLYVFQVNTSEASASLQFLAKIAHRDGVQRSVQIDNRLIAISDDSITVHDISNPTLIVATVVIGDEYTPPTVTTDVTIKREIVKVPDDVNDPNDTVTTVQTVSEPNAALVDLAVLGRADSSTQMATDPAATIQAFDCPADVGVSLDVGAASVAIAGTQSLHLPRLAEEFLASTIRRGNGESSDDSGVNSSSERSAADQLFQSVGTDWFPGLAAGKVG